MIPGTVGKLLHMPQSDMTEEAHAAIRPKPLTLKLLQETFSTANKAAKASVGRDEIEAHIQWAKAHRSL